MRFIPYVLCLFLHLVMAWHFLPHSCDDAHIFFRYARNLTDGFGPVWNPGEIPVEGFSSPLWLILLSVGKVFGLSLPVFGKYLGVLFGLCSIILLKPLASRLGRPETAGWLMCGASLTVSLHYWGASGLESSMVVFLWVASLLALVQNNWIWAPALLGVARPEGIALALTWLLADRVVYKQFEWRKTMQVLFPALIWFAFRLYYYVDWLPNTFYAKVGGEHVEQLLHGLNYVKWPLIAWMLVMISAVYQKDRLLFSAGGFLGVGIAIVAGGGGDWMWWGRLILPMTICLWAFVRWNCAFERFLGLGIVFSLIQLWGGKPCGLGLVCPPVKIWSAISAGKQMPLSAHQEGGLIGASWEVAKEIRQRLPIGSLIAVNHAGALPFYLHEYRFIDMSGLNDRHIAHKIKGGLHKKYDPSYVLRRRPDAVIMNSRTKPMTNGKIYHPDYWEGETALAADPIFKRFYSPAPLYWPREGTSGKPAYLLLFLPN